MFNGLLAYLVVLPLLLVCVLVIFYLERKIAAFMQDRLGPTHVGKYGMLQPIADLLKLIQKEDIVPAKADKPLFKLAPFIVFTATFAGFAVLPLTSAFQPVGLETGVFYIMAIISLDVIGILMAGWASNNKYALFGAMRAIAQVVSYEIPVGLSILSVVIIAQSLDLQQISYLQSIFTFHSNFLTNAGGIFAWNIFRFPHLILAWLVFFIATLAECNRAPFDIPEAESELVAGYHVEYSGFRFAKFFLAEYGMMLLVTLMGSILFLGSWNSPFPNIGVLKLADWTNGKPGTLLGHILGGFWLLSKTFLQMFVQIWIRWTLPRLRIDQLMNLCWKYLTPLALILIIVSSLYRL
jgi:NADH-quinone oxidoreductase subunit H